VRLTTAAPKNLSSQLLFLDSHENGCVGCTLGCTALNARADANPLASRRWN
jgi:hypothetical protein